MVVINLLLALAMLPLLAIDALGIWIAYVVLFVGSSLEQLFTPAEGALLPNLLENPDDDLVTANALNGHEQPPGAADRAGDGRHHRGGRRPVRGHGHRRGLIPGRRGPDRVHPHRPTRGPNVTTPLEHEAADAWRRLLGEWRDGLRTVVHHPVLRALLVFFVITRIGEGLTATLFVPWTTDALHSDATGYGLLLSTQAIGGFAGAIVIGRLGSRMDPLRLVILGPLAFGLIDLGLFTYPAIYPYIGPALVVMVVVGVPGAAMMAAIATLEQTLAADSHRGRVIGAMGHWAQPVRWSVRSRRASWARSVPVVLLLVVQGSGYVIASLTVAWMTRRERVPSVPLSAAEG